MTTPYLFVPIFSWPAAPGGKLYTYAALGTTPKTTYSDSAGVVPNDNPVVLDASGSATVRLAAGAYHFVLKDSTGVTTLWDADNYQSSFLVASDIGQLLYPQTAGESAAGVTPSSYVYPEGHPYRYSMTGDGSTDDSTAFLNWLKVGAQGVALKLVKPTSYYKINSAVVLAALAGPLRITAERGAEVRYTGSNTSYAVQIQDTNGYDIEIERLWGNCNLKAAKFMRIDNASASMASTEIGKAVFKRCRFENGYMNTSITQGSAAVMVVGGFTDVIFDDCDAINMNRATGAGVAGSQGCAGFIGTFTSINAYIQRMIVRGGNIDTITNSETTGAGADVDCDGVIFSAPTATDNGGYHVPVKLDVQRVRFVNAKGRCVKSQADGYSLCHGNTIIRNLEEAIANAVEFDLQRGGGSIRHNELWYYEKSGTGTTLGTSHCVVSAGTDQLAITGNNASGSVECSDNTVYNAIPSATDTLPFFMLATNDDTSRKLTGISLCNNRMVGGRVSRWLKSNGGTADELNICVQNNDGDTTTALVQFSAAVGSLTHLSVGGNRTYGGGTPVLIELATSAQPSAYVGAENSGFVETGLALKKGSGVVVSAGAVADDATYTFPALGTNGRAIITSNFGVSVQPAFRHGSADCVLDGVASADVSYGTANTDPDTDGDLNIWIDGSGQLNIKNRLGSSKTFVLTHYS